MKTKKNRQAGSGRTNVGPAHEEDAMAEPIAPVGVGAIRCEVFILYHSFPALSRALAFYHDLGYNWPGYGNLFGCTTV